MQTESRRLEYEAPKLEVQELLAYARTLTGSEGADNGDDNGDGDDF